MRSPVPVKMVAFRMTVVSDGKGWYVDGKGSGKRGPASAAAGEGPGAGDTGAGPCAWDVAHPVTRRTASPMEWKRIRMADLRGMGNQVDQWG
jgi:hypothetical protein